MQREFRRLRRRRRCAELRLNSSTQRLNTAACGSMDQWTGHGGNSSALRSKRIDSAVGEF